MVFFASPSDIVALSFEAGGAGRIARVEAKLTAWVKRQAARPYAPLPGRLERTDEPTC
jgi:hypothetical protein